MRTANLPEHRPEDIEGHIADLVEKMIGRPIGKEEPIMEAGLDSLGAVEMRASLQNNLAVELPATLTFDYPNIASLAKYLTAQLSAVSPQIKTTQVQPSSCK